jgi:hypothetical protein
MQGSARVPGSPPDGLRDPLICHTDQREEPRRRSRFHTWKVPTFGLES